MRRTKHRRRFHTDRVIRNRQHRYRREAADWELAWRRDLEDGQLADRFAYYGCSRPRCFLCHFEKLIGDRRTREKRVWHREVGEQLGEDGR